jgi:glycerol uptake facilitator protein
MHASLARCFVAEVIGTFILVFLGCGAVHSAVVADSLTGLFQIGIVWGIAIMAAAYTVGAISGAHINPAITVALALFGRFAWRRVPAYVLAQVLGAFVAASALYAIYRGNIDELEAGGRTVATAKCYGEYFGTYKETSRFNDATYDRLKPQLEEAQRGGRPDSLIYPNHLQAFGAEVLGTALLALVVVATTDPRNRGAPAERFAPVFIGLTVTALICVIAPLTQACFNPARDFGPRLFTYFAGWKEVAIPGPNGVGFFTVYIVAPTLGAILGAAVYEWVLKPGPNERIEAERGTTT